MSSLHCIKHRHLNTELQDIHGIQWQHVKIIVICACKSNCMTQTYATNLQRHSQGTLIHDVEIANCCLHTSTHKQQYDICMAWHRWVAICARKWITELLKLEPVNPVIKNGGHRRFGYGEGKDSISCVKRCTVMETKWVRGTRHYLAIRDSMVSYKQFWFILTQRIHSEQVEEEKQGLRGCLTQLESPLN